jgi:hypothetical protein
LSSQVAALQSEVSDLQTDNVKLYEKIRFLQGFQVHKLLHLLKDTLKKDILPKIIIILLVLQPSTQPQSRRRFKTTS